MRTSHGLSNIMGAELGTLSGYLCLFNKPWGRSHRAGATGQEPRGRSHGAGAMGLDTGPYCTCICKTGTRVLGSEGFPSLLPTRKLFCPLLLEGLISI